MFESHKKAVQKTAHYYTLGRPSTGTKYFWIICHGYGQLASRFIQQFQLLNLEEHFILAPEGFHRFYWQGFSGDVVASWMTKADRLDDIKDYTTHLQELHEEYLTMLPQNVNVILFGFSQGCATVCRWVNAFQPKFDKLVLWGGALPEDIDYQPLLPYLSLKEIIFAYGTSDQFLTVENRIEKHIKFARANKLEMSIWPFEGKHETRKTIVKKIAEEVVVNKI